jgi:hypothetical protein
MGGCGGGQSLAKNYNVRIRDGFVVRAGMDTGKKMVENRSERTV